MFKISHFQYAKAVESSQGLTYFIPIVTMQRCKAVMMITCIYLLTSIRHTLIKGMAISQYFNKMIKFENSGCGTN